MLQRTYHDGYSETDDFIMNTDLDLPLTAKLSV